MKFIEYDRVTDKLIWLSSTMSLNFSVSLASKDKQGMRKSFYYETEYDSNFTGTKVGRSVKRNLNYYFIIETQSFGNGLVLRPRDVYFVTEGIKNQVLPWFFDKKNRIYSIKDNRLIISGKYNPLIYQPDQYRSLIITPIVLELENGFKEGVRIECNSEFSDIDIDKFMDIYYILTNTDMYSVACQLINFAKIPPFGENIWKPIGLGGGGKPDDGWNDNNINNNDNNKKRNSFLDSK